MRNFYFIIVCVFLSSTVTAQDNTTFLFSYTLHRNIKSYSKQSDLAYQTGDTERGRFLFDSLVQNQLVGTLFDDFNLKRYHKNRLRLSTVSKPVFLITYASWCVPGKGEIPALNKLARQYGKDVQFIVLYWDRKANIKKLSKKFDSRIMICYAHETYNRDAYLVSTLKHSLGFPLTYLLDEKRNVVSIKRGIIKPDQKITYAKAVDANYTSFKEQLNCLLINKINDSSQRLAKH